MCKPPAGLADPPAGTIKAPLPEPSVPKTPRPISEPDSADSQLAVAASPKMVMVFLSDRRIILEYGSQVTRRACGISSAAITPLAMVSPYTQPEHPSPTSKQAQAWGSPSVFCSRAEVWGRI